jgi:3-oxoacyl-[acyl-carrier protein] reductase
MVEHRFGRVVFFVGDGAWAGGAERAHVSAAKMGLVGLCRSLATEFAPHDIRLNVISPGRIDTSRDASWYPTSMDRTEDIPLGRLGNVADIADGCLFLVSDDSRWMTGQTLHINGGSAYF